IKIKNQTYCFVLDTDRALALLEEYCKKLKKPEEQQLKKAIKKVMGIFKSSLFQALLGVGNLRLRCLTSFFMWPFSSSWT
uniref:L27-1 domain-containing protein n=1 Tax=Sphenodon punctatus TaxID=8508 RepID=A0A8D0HA62_SPHPU